LKSGAVAEKSNEAASFKGDVEPQQDRAVAKSKNLWQVFAYNINDFYQYVGIGCSLRWGRTIVAIALIVSGGVFLNMLMSIVIPVTSSMIMAGSILISGIILLIVDMVVKAKAALFLKKLYDEHSDNSGKNILLFGQLSYLVAKEVLLHEPSLATMKDTYGRTVLHRCSNIKIAKLLIHYGADVMACDTDGALPLHYCTDVSVAQFLIEHGSSTESRGMFSRTTLHYAALHGCVDVVNMLLKKGANIDAKDFCEKTAFDLIKDKMEEEDNPKHNDYVAVYNFISQYRKKPFSVVV
jgi:hypothetical protein